MLAPMDDDSLHQPHDKLFKSGFGIPSNARSLFEQHLAPAVIASIDWDTLENENKSFVSTDMRSSESDLLFSAKLLGKETACYLYILFEHVRAEKPFALLNLLFYMVCIWKRHIEQKPASEFLPPIFPVLLAQNENRWEIPEQFRSHLPGKEEIGEALESYMVDFRSHVLQLAEVPMPEIVGTPECVMIMRVMKVAASKDWQSEYLWDEGLLLQMGDGMLERLLLYILDLSDLDKMQVKGIFSKIENKELRSKSMSVAEQFIEEGRQEGEQKGRIQSQQESIIEALQVRFERVPEGLVEEIESIADSAKLTKLHRAAIRCESIDAFAEEL